ncbi:MAG TPA: hypothetical protein VGG98_04220 [Solirubrobacteraceae bacterium]
MFHIELRQFPHNFCRFNLTDEQLHALTVPWARGEWIEAGERKWTPYQAKLTILEGERIPVEQLSIGRGWRNARRQSEDVTVRVLAAALEAGEVAGHAGGTAAGGATARAPSRASATDLDAALVIDSLGPELVRALGEDSARLALAWRAAIEDSPGRSPSVCLALAEEALGSPNRR